MDNLNLKIQINFLVEKETVDKIDMIAEAQRRSRNQQFAFMVDEAFARLFPTPISVVDSLELGEKGSGS